MGSRIRELRHKILHCHNKVLRDIYKSHIIYLESLSCEKIVHNSKLFIIKKFKGDERMAKEKWIEDITEEMIPDTYKDVAEVIGAKSLLKLAQEYGGTMIYIPKFDSLTRIIRDKKIKQEFNGGNYKELALKYNLCESSIRNIINSNIIDGQITLFDKSVI